MITLYTIDLSLYCAKLRILLRHKQLQWHELPPPGGYGSDEYKKIIASGNLPALVEADFKLADSEAIAEYLNEKYPQPPMLPQDIEQRAKVRERSRFHDTRLEPELRKLFPYIDEKNPDVSIIMKQSKALSMRLNQLATELTSDGISITNELNLSDCGFPISFVWMDVLTPVLGLTIDWPDPVVEYKNKVIKHTAVADELNSYIPTLEQWLKNS